MSKQSLFSALALALVGFCGWAIAQQPQPKQAEPARYAVAGAANTAVLVDTASGKTWFLHEGKQEIPLIWLPIERIDDPDQAQKWLAELKTEAPAAEHGNEKK